MASRLRYRPSGRHSAQRGQSLVEAALVLPLLLLLTFGVLGVGRVLQAQMGVTAVAREAARVGALSTSPGQAAALASAQGQAVAQGYQLTNGSLQLTVDPGSLARGGRVRAEARYTVWLQDLPLPGWLHVSVHSAHIERVDLYRSRPPAAGAP